MKRLPPFLLYCLLGVPLCTAYGQKNQQTWLFTGTVYDAHYRPVPYTNVVAHGSGQGDMTDSLGIFSLRVRATDRLSFYNISFHDTTLFVIASLPGIHVRLRQKVYSLPGAMIFDWGSSYQDFIAEVERQGVPEDLGDALGLPKQDPDMVPFDMDEQKLKSGGFLLTSPVSFLYYNLSGREKKARRAFRLKQDRKLIERFNRVLGPTNLERVTGLKNESLEQFMIYLNQQMTCDYHCSELELTRELLEIWKRYKTLQKDEK